MENHVRALVSCVPADGVTVDLQPLFFNLTIDSATDFLLGQSVACQGSPPGSSGWEFSEAFDYAEEAIERRNALGQYAWLLHDPKFYASCQVVHRFMDKYIDETLRSETKTSRRYNLLTELARECRDPIQLRNELLNVLLAARDTTASLLSSIFYLLARHPRVWDTLREEVDQLNGRQPDYDTLKDMRYLKSVLNESKLLTDLIMITVMIMVMIMRISALRVLPPVPMNERFARKDTVLPHGGGPDEQSPIFVARGSRVVYSTWAMHRLPEVWGDDSETYRPERWLEEDPPLRPGWAFLVSVVSSMQGEPLRAAC